MKQKSIEVRGYSYLCVYDNERENSDTIVFLHGLTGNYLHLQHFYKHFANNYRVVAIDVRGRGNSGPAQHPSTMEEHKKDVLEMLAALKITNPILVGYSMGAFIASLVATEITVKKLILLDGLATIDEHQDAILRPSFERLTKCFDTKESYVEFVVGNYGKMGIPDGKDVRGAVEYEVTFKEDGWYNKGSKESIRSDWQDLHSFDVAGIGAAIQCPTLLIQAEGSIGSFGGLFQEKHYQITKQSVHGLAVMKTPANHYNLVFCEWPELVGEMKKFIDKN